MTWAIKIRGDSKALIAAEYECPAHGRFEITVPRDEVPDMMPCRAFNGSGSEMLEARGWPSDKPCAIASPWCFPSPARARVQRVTAARWGKDPERPPGVMDWQAAAYDECSPAEWEARERKKDFEAVHKIVKGALR